MNSYKVLSNQVFTKGEYSLVPIRLEDRYDIMRWRNEQIYHLRQDKLLTESDQDRYFEQVVSKQFTADQPDQILFSFLKNNVCIGYGGLVHINWRDRNAEVSFVMDTQLENEYFEYNWTKYLALIEQVGFEELDLHKLYIYAFDLRPHLYDALVQNKYFNDAILKDHCLHKGKFIDVIIHAKINPKS